MLSGITPAGAEPGGRDKSRTVKRLPDEFVPLLTELARLIERAREQQGERAAGWTNSARALELPETGGLVRIITSQSSLAFCRPARPPVQRMHRMRRADAALHNIEDCSSMCLPVCSSLLLMAYSMLSGNHAGARAQIVNAAFQILEPWSTKSNLSTRIKTLYEKTDDFKAAMEEQLQAKREAFLQDVHASLQRGEWRPHNCASLCASCTFPAPVCSRRPRGDVLQVVYAMSLKREPISLTRRHCLGMGACL